MSSDPFADLSKSLTEFCNEVEFLLGLRWTSESTAAKEAVDQSLAGEWGGRPGRDALLTVHLLAAATFDHLRALATLIVAPRIVYALSSASRGALEAAAQARYLSDTTIEARERVRRYMNGRLVSLHESKRMISALAGEDSEGLNEVTRLASRVEKILCSADRLAFKVVRGDGFRPPYIQSRHPSAMSMIETAVSGAQSGLGALYWRSLSAVSHSQMQGLTSYADPIVALDDVARGDLLAAVGVSARKLALLHAGAPLCAIEMAKEIVTLMGLNSGPLTGSITKLVVVWSRVADVPLS